MAPVAFFLCTTGCFSIFPITRNDTGVYFRLGRSFQDLAVLTAAHRTAPAIRGHIGLSCGVCLSRGKGRKDRRPFQSRGDALATGTCPMPSLGPLRVLAAPRPLGQTQTCLFPPLPFPPAGEGRAVPRLCAGSVAGEGRRGGRGLQRALWTHEGSKTPREKRHLRRGGRGLVTKGTLTRCSSQTGAGGGGGFSRAAA